MPIVNQSCCRPVSVVVSEIRQLVCRNAEPFGDKLPGGEDSGDDDRGQDESFGIYAPQWLVSSPPCPFNGHLRPHSVDDVSHGAAVLPAH